MNRFFIETELTVGSTIQLTESVFHHWVRVLRAQLQEQATPVSYTHLTLPTSDLV